jgi:hypothetical protein
MRRRVGSAKAANVRFNVLEEYLTIWLNILHATGFKCKSKLAAFFEPEETERNLNGEWPGSAEASGATADKFVLPGRY